MSLAPSSESLSRGSKNDEGLSESLKYWPGSMISFGIHSLGVKVLGTSPVSTPASRQPLHSLTVYLQVFMSCPIQLDTCAHLRRELSLAFSSRIISPLARELF